MPSRHRSRERALQVLYLWDMRRESVEDSLETFYGSLATEDADEPLDRDCFTDQLVRGAIGDREEIDRRILVHSENWRLERMPVVDRNILRLAIYEMMREATPHAVVIDEALELARRFSGDESVAFVNGVLDAVRKKLEPARDSEEADC
jgi:N utilization substance protein B